MWWLIKRHRAIRCRTLREKQGMVVEMGARDGRSGRWEGNSFEIVFVNYLRIPKIRLNVFGNHGAAAAVTGIPSRTHDCSFRRCRYSAFVWLWIAHYFGHFTWPWNAVCCCWYYKQLCSVLLVYCVADRYCMCCNYYCYHHHYFVIIFLQQPKKLKCVSKSSGEMKVRQLLNFSFRWCWHAYASGGGIFGTHIYAIIMSLDTFVDFRFWRVRQRSFQSFATHSYSMRRRCKRMLCNFNLNNFWIASKQPQSIIFLGTNAAVLPHSGTQTHNWHIFGMLCTHSCRARCSKVII